MVRLGGRSARECYQQYHQNLTVSPIAERREILAMQMDRRKNNMPFLGLIPATHLTYPSHPHPHGHTHKHDLIAFRLMLVLHQSLSGNTLQKAVQGSMYKWVMVVVWTPVWGQWCPPVVALAKMTPKCPKLARSQNFGICLIISHF